MGISAFDDDAVEELAGIRFRELTEITRESVSNLLIHGLLAYWRGLDDGRLPRKRAFDPLDLPQALGRLTVLERLADGDYLYRLYGLKTSETAGYDLTGKRLRQVAGAAAPFFASRYDRCLELGRPLYTLHQPVNMPTVSLLERLLMPFADDADAPRFVVAFSAPLALSGRHLVTATSRMA
jgi:hypothetical protein